MMKVFILGAKGQLGTDCQKVFAAEELLGVDLPELDATDRAALHAVLSNFKPDVIVNCAAYTAVDQCETEQELCWKANRDIPKYLAEYSRENESFLVQVSTDYVFSGDRPLYDACTENDLTGPVSEYGRSKLAGERAVVDGLGESGAYAILRTAWLYGLNGHNFLKTMFRLTCENPQKTFKVVHDQYGSPTWSYTLARQIKAVIESGSRGVFHSTSEGYCSWYDLACAFLDEMGVEHNLVPCSTEEYPTPAKRPKNSILENARLKELGINQFADWRAELSCFTQAYIAQQEEIV